MAIAGPLGTKVYVLEAVDAGLNEIFRNALVQRTVGRSGPDSGTEGQAVSVRHSWANLVDQFFAGALEVIGALLKSQQGRVADEDGGVSPLEHGVQVGGHGKESTSGFAQWRRRMRAWAKVVRLAVSAATERRAASGCEAWRTSNRERTCPLEAMTQPAERAAGWQPVRRWDQPMSPCLRPDDQRTRMAYAVDLVTKGERGIQRRVLKVPHERRGIEEADGCDTQMRLRCGIHAS